MPQGKYPAKWVYDATPCQACGHPQWMHGRIRRNGKNVGVMCTHNGGHAEKPTCRCRHEKRNETERASVIREVGAREAPAERER